MCGYFVENFTQDNQLTPIEVVEEVCGLSFNEIVNSSSFSVVELTEDNELIQVTKTDRKCTQ